MKKLLRLFFIVPLFSAALLSMGTVEVRAQQAVGQTPRSEIFQRLSDIPGVVSVEPLGSTRYESKFVVKFTQPLDHKNPSAGTFSQRFVVCHRGFDRPVQMVTEGYGGSYALDSNYTEEIAERFKTNLVFVEHRYFLESTPDTTGSGYRYLTAENSACDLHRINLALKALYGGKWIASGISKGGQTTIIYRTFFPDDVDISVPYVAPVCFGVEDGRHEPFLKKAGTARERDMILAFQKEVLSRRATIGAMFADYCNKKEYTFEAPVDEIFDMTVLEYPFSIWQWGTMVSTIPPLSSSDEVLFNHLLKIVEPGYFSNRYLDSFFVQAARELGYYGYDVRPLKNLLSISSAEGHVARYMLQGETKNISFDKALSRKIYDYLQHNDPKMIFIYGQNDPWTAAAADDKLFKGKENMLKVVEPRGSHRSRISTQSLGMREYLWDLLERWLNP